jgi:NitT/TauT family transport system permease protein
MMNWTGGWFFLMAAEIFTAGQRDFRLPELGSYLKEAANEGDSISILLGVIALVFVIVALGQFVWQPLLTWADRFKLETVESRVSHTSWFYDALHSSHIISWFSQSIFSSAIEQMDKKILHRFPMTEQSTMKKVNLTWVVYILEIAGFLGLLYGTDLTGQMLLVVPSAQWGLIGFGLIALRCYV